MKLMVEKAGDLFSGEWRFYCKESGLVSESDVVSAMRQFLDASRWTGTQYMMVEAPK